MSSLQVGLDLKFGFPFTVDENTQKYSVTFLENTPVLQLLFKNQDSITTQLLFKVVLEKSTRVPISKHFYSSGNKPIIVQHLVGMMSLFICLKRYD